MRLPAGAIPIPAELVQDGAQFGLIGATSACEVFGHRWIALRADPAIAATYGLGDRIVGEWCPGCGRWQLT